MGEAAPFGRAGQYALAFRMVFVEGVVEPGDHPRRVAESRVLGDVPDSLAVNPHLATVVEAVEKFLAGVRAQRRFVANGICHIALPSSAWRPRNR